MSEDEPTEIERNFILMEIIQDTLERELNEEEGLKCGEDSPSHIKPKSEEELKIENNNKISSGMGKVSSKPEETSVPTKIPSDLYVEFKETSIPPPNPAVESQLHIKAADRPQTAQTGKRGVNYQRPKSARPPPPRNLVEEIITEDDLEDSNFFNGLTVEQIKMYADPDNEKINMAVEIILDCDTELNENKDKVSPVESEQSVDTDTKSSIDHLFEKKSGNIDMNTIEDVKYGSLVEQILETQRALEGVTIQLNQEKLVSDELIVSTKKASVFLQKYCQYSANLGDHYENYLKDCDEIKGILRSLEKENDVLDIEMEETESNFQSELVPLEEELDLYKNQVMDAQDLVAQLESEIFRQGEQIKQVIVGLYKCGIFAEKQAKEVKEAKLVEEKLKKNEEDASNNNINEPFPEIHFDEPILELIANRAEDPKENIKQISQSPAQILMPEIKSKIAVPKIPKAGAIDSTKAKKKIKTKIPSLGSV